MDLRWINLFISVWLLVGLFVLTAGVPGDVKWTEPSSSSQQHPYNEGDVITLGCQGSGPPLDVVRISRPTEVVATYSDLTTNYNATGRYRLFYNSSQSGSALNSLNSFGLWLTIILRDEDSGDYICSVGDISSTTTTVHVHGRASEVHVSIIKVMLNADGDGFTQLDDNSTNDIPVSTSSTATTTVIATSTTTTSSAANAIIDNNTNKKPSSAGSTTGTTTTTAFMDSPSTSISIPSNHFSTTSRARGARVIRLSPLSRGTVACSMLVNSTIVTPTISVRLDNTDFTAEFLRRAVRLDELTFSKTTPNGIAFPVVNHVFVYNVSHPSVDMDGRKLVCYGLFPGREWDMTEIAAVDIIAEHAPVLKCSPPTTRFKRRMVSVHCAVSANPALTRVSTTWSTAPTPNTAVDRIDGFGSKDVFRLSVQNETGDVMFEGTGLTPKHLTYTYYITVVNIHGQDTFTFRIPDCASDPDADCATNGVASFYTPYNIALIGLLSCLSTLLA